MEGARKRLAHYAGPRNPHDDKVDSDQQVVNKEISLTEQLSHLVEVIHRYETMNKGSNSGEFWCLIPPRTAGLTTEMIREKLVFEGYEPGRRRGRKKAEKSWECRRPPGPALAGSANEASTSCRVVDFCRPRP